MKMENKPITELKELLEKEGFKTTWRNPFFSWLYPPLSGNEKPELDAGDILYILDLPIPKVAPLDPSLFFQALFDYSVAVRVIFMNTIAIIHPRLETNPEEAGFSIGFEFDAPINRMPPTPASPHTPGQKDQHKGE